MSVGISLRELLVWNQEASGYWRAHLADNAHLLELPCDIGGTKNVQGFVRHIWGVELRWSQRLAGLPVMGREEMPAGPLDALFDMHGRAVEILSGVLAEADENWEKPYVLEIDSLPPEARTVSRRKVAVHMLFHSQRHWAQLATLVRGAGFPSVFRGDFLFSTALR